MSNHNFRFKQFTIQQDRCAMKVSTDGVLLGAWAETGGANKILDVGSGTGLLALMLAQRTDSMIDAVEIDKDAYNQSIENAQQTPWIDRLNFIHSSFQDFAASSNSTYDLIVSNPPYFNNSLKNPDQLRTMARHTDSLPFAELLLGCTHLLNPNGRLCVVLPYVESQLFVVEAVMSELYCVKKVNIKPTPSKKVLRVLMEFSRERRKADEHELIISNDSGSYTSEYRELTKDYYLFF